MESVYAVNLFFYSDSKSKQLIDPKEIKKETPVKAAAAVVVKKETKESPKKEEEAKDR